MMPTFATRTVQLEMGHSPLNGIITLPQQAQGIVIFTGDDSSDLISSEREVAEALNGTGLATLLMSQPATVKPSLSLVETARLAVRQRADELAAITDWVAENPETRDMAVGYYGVGTGGVVSLIAASKRGNLAAVAIRNSKPALASPELRTFEAPLLCIIAEEDSEGIQSNQAFLNHLATEKRLVVIPGVRRDFTESKAMGRVASLVRNWFDYYLSCVGQWSLKDGSHF